MPTLNDHLAAAIAAEPQTDERHFRRPVVLTRITIERPRRRATRATQLRMARYVLAAAVLGFGLTVITLALAPLITARG